MLNIIEKTEIVNQNVITAPYSLLIIFLIIILIVVVACIIHWKKRR